MYKAKRKYDEKEFAIKVSIKSVKDLFDKEKKDLEDETKYMKSFHHPFIVNVIDDFVDSAGK